MSRQRHKREAKALRLLQMRPSATAVEIGSAAVEGEDRARNIRWRDREAIGLSIALRLVRRGFARATHSNSFTSVGR